MDTVSVPAALPDASGTNDAHTTTPQLTHAHPAMALPSRLVWQCEVVTSSPCDLDVDATAAIATVTFYDSGVKAVADRRSREIG
jgi:hypothetical protein